MVFRNFRVQVAFRIILLAAAIGIFLWCLLHEHPLRTVYAAVATVIIIVEFIWYVDRFNRDITSFLISLMQRDFTTHFQSQGRSKSFDELYKALNQISEVFKAISAEKEAQFRFLQMLIEHIRVGVLSVDETGKITLANQAARDLLKKDVLFSLKALESFDASFVSVLRDIRSNETRLYKLRLPNELLHLSIHASEFKLEGKYHKLISMQNIRNELDAQEMEAWQKLIRVLTHEIMNSVSPITSLSETMNSLVSRNHHALDSLDSELYNTLHKGLDAIRVRSEGLFNFTQSYRKLTGVPKVSLKNTNTRDLIDRVVVLMEAKVHEKGIALKASAPGIAINVDPDLMEHVLINLLLNAMDAVAESPNPVISLGALRDGRGDVLLYVADNGEGIDEATAEKIFIPFFTTRKDGSGVGLALAKQILHLHHAEITFHSEKGKGTEFVIRL